MAILVTRILGRTGEPVALVLVTEPTIVLSPRIAIGTKIQSRHDKALHLFETGIIVQLRIFGEPLKSFELWRERISESFSVIM